MISILATTAFFTAVTADSNLTWLPLFDLKPQTLNTPQPELKEVGYGTCFDVTEKGIGYNLELAKFCKDVTDYELQCAGEDLEGLPTATATKKQKKETEEVEGDRRLEVEEEKEEEEKEEVEEEVEGIEAKVATTTISPEELAELEKTWEAQKTQVYDENIKAYGALASCIERSRYYSSSLSNTSWLHAEYAKLTCKEVIDQFGDGSCDSENSKHYALNVCCPKTCNTSEKLDCEAEEQASIEEAAIKENETGAGKLDEVCEGHSDCGANLQCGSESRPATPAPTEAPTNAAETVDETVETEASTEASASEAVRLLGAAETEKDAAETEEDAAETVDETVDETVETETEEVETVETAQKKCQTAEALKAGASYYGFGFLAALLAVVSL